MKIDYDNLTFKELEEYVEFIDWSRVPYRLIIEDVKKSFGFLPQLGARIWFEDLLLKMEIKEDLRIYSNSIFFFIENDLYMSFDLETDTLWCHNERIWSILNKKFNFTDSDIISFIENLSEIYFKNIETTPMSSKTILSFKMKAQFKTITVKTLIITVKFLSFLENNFKNIKAISI